MNVAIADHIEDNSTYWHSQAALSKSTHPLRFGAESADVVLQNLDGLLDVVVDDGEVEEVAIGVLQQVRLLGEPLQAAVELGVQCGDGIQSGGTALRIASRGTHRRCRCGDF